MRNKVQLPASKPGNSFIRVFELLTPKGGGKHTQRKQQSQKARKEMEFFLREIEGRQRN